MYRGRKNKIKRALYFSQCAAKKDCAGFFFAHSAMHIAGLRVRVHRAKMQFWHVSLSLFPPILKAIDTKKTKKSGKNRPFSNLLRLGRK